MKGPIRVAFVKYAGMSGGGTERWLQSMAMHLPRDRFDVTFFWAESVREIGSGQMAPATDPHRLAAMSAAGVDLVEFHLDALDLRRPTTPWKDTDFWEVFDPAEFDLVQTSKTGLPEYPFVGMPVPVFEQVAYNGGVDPSPSIVRSGHPSEWSRAWWCRRGGRLERSFVHPIPTAPPVGAGDLRTELDITADALVVGFHQRPDDGIMSPVQLAAVAQLHRSDIEVVVLGGSPRYQQQAADLGLQRCHFLPPTGDSLRISSFLRTLDVYIHGRRDGETFGLVLAEAMAHGVPCLSHRVPGNANAQRETIGPGGEVADDVGAYAIALHAFLDDPERRSLVGARAEQHAAQRFGIVAAVGALATEYESFLVGHRPPKVWSYGEVAQGFLLSGTIEDLADPASAVVTGSLPGSEVIAAIDAVLPLTTSGVVEVTSDLRPVVVWLAARCGPDQTITVYENRPETCEELLVDLRLNGVEERVELLHHQGCPFGTGGLAEADPRRTGVVVRRHGTSEVDAPGAEVALFLDDGWAASPRWLAPPGSSVCHLRSGSGRWTVAGDPDLMERARVAFRRDRTSKVLRAAQRSTARRVIPLRQRGVLLRRLAQANLRALR